MQLRMQFESTPMSRAYLRQFEKAAAVALTRTAWDVRKELTEEMESVFDNPTPFTLRAFRVDMAKASDLTATVWAGKEQARYLRQEIEGGERNTKGFERKMHLFGGEVALPGAGAKLNTYGNMPLSFIKRVAGDLNTYGKDKRFFVGKPKGGRGMPEGVWARTNNNQRLTPLMVFAEDATYEKRFKASAIAGQTVDRVFESRLMEALRQYAGQ